MPRPPTTNGRTPGLVRASCSPVGPNRTINSSECTPTVMLPLVRKARPPNIFLARTAGSTSRRSCSRSASVSSYAMSHHGVFPVAFPLFLEEPRDGTSVQAESGHAAVGEDVEPYVGGDAAGGYRETMWGVRKQLGAGQNVEPFVGVGAAQARFARGVALEITGVQVDQGDLTGRGQ